MGNFFRRSNHSFGKRTANNNRVHCKMILILGVTASGKGRLAFELAENLDAEIVSIDSMKVYRRMDVGTAKPPKEARQRIRYHLIDVVEPSDSFSVSAFLDAAESAVEDIQGRGKRVIGVGGTALYIKALMYGLFDGPGTDEEIRSALKEQAERESLAKLHLRLQEIDPEAAERIHPNDAKRIIRALEVFRITGKPISSFQRQWTQDDENRGTKHNWTIIGLRRQKEQESIRINVRVKKMIASGLVDEVRGLLSEDKPLSEQARCAIGYAEIIRNLAGEIDLDEAVELIKRNTRRLAKGQRTWFKTFKDVNWLDIEDEETSEKILSRANELLQKAR